MHQEDVAPDMTSTPTDDRQVQFPNGDHQKNPLGQHSSLPQGKPAWGNTKSQDSRFVPSRGVPAYQPNTSAQRQPANSKNTPPPRQMKPPNYVRTGLKQPAAYRSPVRLNTTKSSPRQTDGQPRQPDCHPRQSDNHPPQYTKGRVQATMNIYKNLDNIASTGDSATVNGYGYGSEGPPGYKEMNNNRPERSSYYENEVFNTPASRATNSQVLLWVISSYARHSMSSYTDIPVGTNV